MDYNRIITIILSKILSVVDAEPIVDRSTPPKPGHPDIVLLTDVKDYPRFIEIYINFEQKRYYANIPSTNSHYTFDSTDKLISFFKTL